MHFSFPFSFAALIAITTQSVNANLSGLYRIQTIDDQGLVLTGQGSNNAPVFKEPIGDSAQIWRFEDEGDGTTLIQNVPTHDYIDCRSGSCLESKNAQRFNLESHGPNRYVFRDATRQKALRQAAQDRIELADSDGSDEGFDVIRVEF